MEKSRTSFLRSVVFYNTISLPDQFGLFESLILHLFGFASALQIFEPSLIVAETQIPRQDIDNCVTVCKLHSSVEHGFKRLVIQQVTDHTQIPRRGENR
jgi:hypothetical protein